MSKSTILSSVSGALFDLRASFDNRQVSTIFEDWGKSGKTHDDAVKILKPFLVSGTIVLSDSSGLSKLSRERPMSEVLSLVQAPKEYIFSHGTAIGGTAIGVWAADNTAMFYNRHIPVAKILSMLTSQREAMKNELVKVGIGVHSGSFYRLGEAYYGDEYHFIDEVSENGTSGDEIVISKSTRALLTSETDFSFFERKDLEARETIYRLEDAPKIGLPGIEQRRYHFALPFPKQFYNFLVNYPLYQQKGKVESSLARYTSQKTVLLIDVHRQSFESTEVTILENLAQDFRLRKVIRSLIRKYSGTEIKTGGAMSILVFPDTENAFLYAQDIRKKLVDEGLQLRIGIDRSNVLLFNLGKRGKDIAGMAVNIASKLAQDYGEYGSIYVNENAGLDRKGGAPFKVEISKVEVRGTRW